MATGRLPFAGTSTSETTDRILHGQPEAVARFNYNVTAELERIVRKCLEKDRERRYQSARELLIDLRNLKRDSDSTARAVEKKVAPRPWSSARRLAASTIALAIATILGITVYLLMGRSESIDSMAVAVVNASADSSNEYLSDGITESLINNPRSCPA
jgi:serine/threonine protein kinase